MVNAHVPVCRCGSLRFDRHFERFLMRWWLTCQRCGQEHPTVQANLKVEKKRRWVDGKMNQYGGWVPGHWVDE